MLTLRQFLEQLGSGSHDRVLKVDINGQLIQVTEIQLKEDCVIFGVINKETPSAPEDSLPPGDNDQDTA